MRKLIVLGILLGLSLLGVWVGRDILDVVQPLSDLARRSVGVRTSAEPDGQARKVPRSAAGSNTATFTTPENQVGHSGAGEEPLSLIAELVNLVQQFFPDGGDFPMRVWPDKGTGAVYVAGEKLAVHVAPGANAYLQVDYFQSDGTVVHVLPNPQHHNFVESGKTFVIGRVGGGYEFVVTAPFGEELLLVIASQEPLEAGAERPLVEPAAEYIERFLAGLKSQQDRGKVSGAHAIIWTKQF